MYDLRFDDREHGVDVFINIGVLQTTRERCGGYGSAIDNRSYVCTQALRIVRVPATHEACAHHGYPQWRFSRQQSVRSGRVLAVPVRTTKRR